MTVEQLDVVDFVWANKEKTRAYVTISDHLNWGADDEEPHHLYCLHEKIRRYLHFIESGQLEEHDPSLKGLPVTIHVRAKYPVEGQGHEFYKRARKVVEDAGYTLELEVPPNRGASNG